MLLHSPKTTAAISEFRRCHPRKDTLVTGASVQKQARQQAPSAADGPRKTNQEARFLAPFRGPQRIINAAAHSGGSTTMAALVL